MIDLDAARKKYSTIFKVAILGVLGLVVAPFILMAIGGLIGLIVAAGIIAIAFAVAPVLSMKLTNWKIQAIKAEAWKNPVPTMQAIYNANEKKLAQTKTDIEKFSSDILTSKSDYESFKRDFPNSVQRVEIFRKQIAQMESLKEARKRKWQEAKADLTNYESVIKEADAIWRLAMSAKRMGDNAGIVEDPYENMKKATALLSVESAMNDSFAQLEVMMMEEAPTNPVLLVTKQEPQLLSSVIDVTPVQVPSNRS